MPSLHCAVAPAGLLFTPELETLPAAAGFGAGATVVCAGAFDVVVRHAARALLYHLLQSVVVAVVVLVVLVVLTAPAVLPLEVCAAAVRQTVLFLLPALVQSYWRVAVLVVTAEVRVFVRVALFAAGATLDDPLQADLFAFPGFEQS